MSQVNPPNQYFPTIIYNPQFWTSSSSGNYLLRIGTPTSIASNTTFTGSLTTNGIVNTGTMTTTTPSTSDNSSSVATTAYVKNQGYTTLSAVQSNNNAFTGTTTFNSSLPTSTLTPTTSTQLITKAYGDLTYGSSSILTPNNTFSGVNTFTQTIVGNCQGVFLNNTNGTSTYYFLLSPFNTVGGSRTYVPPSTVSLNYNSSTNLLTLPNINSTGTATFSNLTYSNISSSVSITNGDFQLPLQSGVGFLQLATGSTTYAPNASFLTSQGFTGWGISGSNYTLGIQYGTTDPSHYYFTYFPVGSQTIILIGNSETATMISQNYTLSAGEYIFTFQIQSQGMGNLVASVMTGSTTVISSKSLNVNANYPNWITYSLPFSVSTSGSYFFKFALDNGYVGIYAQSLILDNAIVISDGTNTATIGGSQSILNDVFVNNGLTIESGGLGVIGSVSMGTAYGTNNLAINTIMGASSSTNTNVLAIGNGALQNSTSSSSVVAIGNGAGSGLTSASNTVLIGNAFCGNVNNCVGIGYGIGLGYNNTFLLGNNIGNNGGPGSGSSNVGIGQNIYNSYDGYGSQNPTNNVAIGINTQSQNGDSYNTSVGNGSLYNMNGLGYGIAYNTQYNSALGYNAGSSQQQINNCTFLGANSDVSVNNLTNVTCVGYNTKCGTSNTIQLGSNSERVNVSGALNTSGLATFTAGITASATQTITFGTNAPIMSGANIGSRTVPDGALSTNVPLLNATNTFSGLNQITSQYVHSSFTLTTGTSLSISTPIYEIYPLAPTANLTITLPTASASLIGVRIQFRRTGGTTTVTINSASSNIYPNNSLTLTNSIMASGVYTAVIYCTYVTASTYAWYFA